MGEGSIWLSFSAMQFKDFFVYFFVFLISFGSIIVYFMTLSIVWRWAGPFWLNNGYLNSGRIFLVAFAQCVAGFILIIPTFVFLWIFDFENLNKEIIAKSIIFAFMLCIFLFFSLLVLDIWNLFRGKKPFIPSAAGANQPTISVRERSVRLQHKVRNIDFLASENVRTEVESPREPSVNLGKRQ